MKIKIGDRITFKAATRSGCQTATRIVNGFYGATRKPTVRFNGYGGFVVHHREISEVIPS